MNYPVVIEGTSTGGYSAFVPDIEGVYATGRTREEVERRIREGMGARLADARAGHPAPAPTAVADLALEDVEDEHEVVLLEPISPNPVSRELARLMREHGVSQYELARRLGVKQPSVARLLNPFYFGHNLETLRRVAGALGRKLEVAFPEDAAPEADPRAA